MSFIDDDRPQKKAAHEIGADLSMLSVDELKARVELAEDGNRPARGRGRPQGLRPAGGGKASFARILKTLENKAIGGRKALASSVNSAQC